MGLGSMSDWTVHAAELVAILQVTEIIAEAMGIEPEQDRDRDMVCAIVSDSQSATRAIANPTSRPGQHIVRRILGRLRELRRQRIKVRLSWVPAHAGVNGNEMADQLAQQATSLRTQHEYQQPVSTYKSASHRKIADEWRQE